MISFNYIRLVFLNINNFQQQVIQSGQMLIDSKPRDFSYIQHKLNQPIQLKGTMKRHPRPQSSKPISSHTVIVRDTQLVNKIVQNYQELKSIVPFQLENKKRQESVKVYHHQKYEQVAGAAYLMAKSKVEKEHCEKRHLTERNTYQNIDLQPNKQKRHFCEKNKETMKNEKPECVPKKHSETLYKKLEKDLYSQFGGKENGLNSMVKMSEKNMFKQGTALGYEIQREPKMSIAKKKQVAGSILSTELGQRKTMNQNWRKSSILLG